jgi:hypothetical protein
MNSAKTKARLPYASPKLEIYGTVSDLTATVVPGGTLDSDHHNQARSH